MAKKKTIKQKKNKYRNLEYTFTGASYVSALSPFVAIGLANYDKYFVEYDGTKMSIAFVMALAMMGIALWGITKKKLENTLVSLMIKWTICAFIFTMLGQMITDLATIMWFGLAGLFGSYLCDEGSKRMKSKKERVVENMKKAEDQKDVEQYSKEIENE